LAFILALFMLIRPSLFIVGASASTSYTLDIPREALHGYVDDIGLFQRHMPGVVGVTPLGEGKYLYQTEKDIPLSGTMKTDFIIAKSVIGDSVTIYESVNQEDANYMSCQVLIRPITDHTTMIVIDIRLRLIRDGGSEVHWLAPILGQDFISSQMTKDLTEMLEQFVDSSNKELYARLKPTAAN